KVLAAKRAGIHTIVLPKRNDKDLVEVPDHVKVNIDFHFIDKLDDALPVVFDTAAQERREEKVEERLEKTV
ncbi:MAG: S16 family serine protease, partial [Candidatus Bathyanammoxibius sp.]